MFNLWRTNTPFFSNECFSTTKKEEEIEEKVKKETVAVLSILKLWIISSIFQLKTRQIV